MRRVSPGLMFAASLFGLWLGLVGTVAWLELVAGACAAMVGAAAFEGVRSQGLFRYRLGPRVAVRAKPAPAPEPPAHRTQPASWGYGAGSTAGAVAVALLGLYRRRLPRLVLVPAARALGPPVAVLRTVHSGVIGDYVAWLTVGAAGLGVLFVATLR